MHNLYKYACNELQELEDKAGSGGLSMQELEYADKLTEMKKNILKIWMLEGRSEYSGNYYGRSYRGSYDMMNRGGNGNMDGESLYDGMPDPDHQYSGRGRRRDRMGRYSSAGVSNRSYRGYSTEQGMDEMIQELQELLPEIPADKQKNVQKLIHTLETM